MEEKLKEDYPELKTDDNQIIIDEDPEIPNVSMGNHGEDVIDEKTALYLLMWLLLNTTVLDDEWNKFEDTLYELGLDDVINANDWFVEDNVRDREGDINLFRVAYNYDNMAKDLYSSVLYIQDLFKEWINSVDIYETEKLPVESLMKEDSFYLSFNYTETLEKIYGISSDQIIHIHGLRYKARKYYSEQLLLSQDKEQLIFGHGKDEVRDFGFRKIEQSSANSILSKAIGELRKPVDKIIKSHIALWKVLKDNDIKNVYSFGFSYAEVDTPYIKKIVSALNGGENVIWHLNSYDDKDDRNTLFEEIIRECGFKGIFGRFA